MSATRILRIVALLYTAAQARAQHTASLDADQWQVEADGDKDTLQISHARLGAVLTDARLRPAASWTIEKTDDHHLAIRTENPRGAWSIETGPNFLKISTTFTDASIMALAPAPLSRIPARTLDTTGAPVLWQGTSEVKNGYDGIKTSNRSFLPRTNADAMFFALGQVSGSQFHALFDRPTDTAIEFQEGAILSREAAQADTLLVTLPVPGNTLVRLIPDYFTSSLGVPYYTPFDDSHFKTAPMVWSSWTSYYEAVNEADIVRNADWLAANLKPYGFQYVQLDDGYDRSQTGEHTWIGPWDKKTFPHGPQWLTAYIKDKGLKAGLWLVPSAYAGAYATHPDWYLRNKQGKVILDYQTPALDQTNPEVLNFVKHLFTTLDDWGFDYYKFDGEHALAKYIPNVDHTKLHDPSADLLGVYRDRLKMIRDTLGPDRFIEGCPAGTPLNGIGYFNSYFNGEDLYNNWEGMYPLFTSITSNAFLNHIAVYVMPGEGLELGQPMSVEKAMKDRPPVVLATARNREKEVNGFGTTLSEARTLVTYISLTGVAYPLASVMPELPKERTDLLKATMPTLPILPMDLYSRGGDIEWDTFKRTSADYYIHNYPELLDLKVNNTLGTYDVVGLTNWRSGTATRKLSLASQLGLPSNESYLAFDFWNRKLLGVFKDNLTVDVDSHDTRVLLLHPDAHHPQVLGTSRHLTGAYSLADISWDFSRSILAGKSTTVAGDPYTLWLYVPAGYTVGDVEALAGAKPIAVTRKQDGNLLTITFDGVAESVTWRASFLPQIAPKAQAAQAVPGNGLAQHPFLYCGEWQNQSLDNQVMYLVRDGQVTWTYTNPKHGELGDCTRLSNGNIVFSRQFGASEVTPDKRIVWNYDAPPGTEIHTAYPIGAKKVLIMQNGSPAKLLILRKSDNHIEKELTLPTKTASTHGQFRRIRPTKQGTFLVAHMDFGKVVEYSAQGKELWSVAAPGAWAAVRLNNGNTLISGNQNGYVREVNHQGQIVWEINKTDLPDYPLYTVQEASRLSNGNTLINNWTASLPKDKWAATFQLIEVTPAKKVVWALSDWKTLGPASATQLLDEPGKPESGGLER